MRYRHVRLNRLALLAAAALAGCGGGSTVSEYTIAGTVRGLDPGAQLVLANNAGDATTVTQDGAFTFPGKVAYDGSYAVTVVVQPPAQACTVDGGTGSAVKADVSSVVVTCAPAILAVLHSFDPMPDGVEPVSNVLLASDGNFYGTTYRGGHFGLGAVYRITPAGVETVLYSFAGGYYDGSFPAAGLIQGADGVLYGTTANGGPTGEGTVFALSLDGVERVIHAFTGFDGIGPVASLVQGSDGSLFGTTSGGNGTVFRISPSGVATTIHAFVAGTTDGSVPSSALVIGTDGSLYGTTSYGGAYGDGTAFRITPDGVEAVLHSFRSSVDGSAPQGALLDGGDGFFYGTTRDGGPGNAGCVFRMAADGSTMVLHGFAGAPSDGAHPAAALLQGSDGAFYGTTRDGGADDKGTVFRMTATGAETLVYSFATSAPDGHWPVSALARGGDGALYATTEIGGAGNNGALVRIAPSGSETIVHSFGSGPEGHYPAGLVQGADGNLYGATYAGGTRNAGTVFRVARDGAETVLYSFAGDTNDGSYPMASPVQGSDGALYGTTQTGGANGLGTVYRIAVDGSETLLHSFAGGADGSLPQAALVEGKDGSFYGTTHAGGAGDAGTVFRITPAGTETVLYQFSNGSDGSFPHAALLQASDGNFYGTTSQGGGGGVGTVFRITPAGVLTTLYAFAGGADAALPQAALIEGSDGKLYGTSQAGGTNASGTVFRVSLSGTEEVVHSFAGGGADGADPESPLVQANDGNFYGTTRGGGGAGTGTLYRVSPGGVEAVLHSFPQGPEAGAGPPVAMVLGSDGIFYGMTYFGGSSDHGSLFAY